MTMLHAVDECVTDLQYVGPLSVRSSNKSHVRCIYIQLEVCET